jgi:molecular chaperone GrpE
MAAPPPKESPEAESAFSSEEVSPAEDFAPATASPASDTADGIRKLEAEKRSLMDQLLRKQAEFDNFRKRAQREKEEFLQYALFDAVKSLLPILDGFELAIGAEGGGEDYRKGVELIYQQLRTALRKLGLKEIETKGRQFDPSMHEAVSTLETVQYPDHEIVDELQKGYFFKERLLRPAMVQVARNTSGRGNAQEND